MSTAIGADALALLLPRVDPGHPVVALAVRALADLTRKDRADVLSALLGGLLTPGALPAPVLAAAVADDWPYERGDRLAAALGHYPPPGAVPRPLLSAAWASGTTALRTQMLARPGVTKALRQAWLAELSPGELAALLAPGSPTADLDPVLAEVRRRDRASARAGVPAPERPAHQVLLAGPLHPAAFAQLAGALPAEPPLTAPDPLADARRLDWAEQMLYLLRAQSHLVAPLVCGELDPTGPAAGAGPLTPAQRAAALRVLELRSLARSEAARLLDVLGDADLAALTGHLLAQARVTLARAQLLASLPEQVDPAAVWRQWRQAAAGPGAPEADQPADETRVVAFAEHYLADRARAIDWMRRLAVIYLGALTPLLTDKPHGHRPGDWARWAASDEQRALLRGQVAAAVFTGLVPDPPDPAGYFAGGWAELVAAAWPARAGEQRPVLSADQERRLRTWSQEWLRRHGRSADLEEKAAVLALQALTAPAPAPARPAAPARVTAATVLAELDAALAHGDDPAAAAEAVDAALAQVLTVTGLDVDAVLARAADPAASLLRMAGNLPALARATGRPNSPQLRAEAVRAVLGSAHLDAQVLLALPAFAVFGPLGRWAAEQRAVDVAGLLLAQVGDDPRSWRRLQGVEVANRGPQAWQSAAQVLRAARTGRADPGQPT